MGINPFMKLLRASLVFSLLGLTVAALHAATPDEVIAKARARLGGDAKLAALKSVHYIGTLSTVDKASDGTEKPLSLKIEIIFQKPYRQRIVTTSDTRIETTGLDGYEGWQSIEDPKDPKRKGYSLMNAAQIKRLRANTWENLAFFKGIEDRGGELKDLGMATVDGVSCHKLAFIHEPDIIFYRYFDEATGRLVLSETEAGGTIREEGEKLVDGLHFPEKIITSNQLPDGSTRTVTITFSSVTVNENFDDSLFAVPSLGQP